MESECVGAEIFCSYALLMNATSHKLPMKQYTYLRKSVEKLVVELLPLILTHARRRGYKSQKTLVGAQLWLDWYH